MQNWLQRLQLARRYIHYYLIASNSKGHGIHSPFVFDFITRVLNDKRSYYSYRHIEALRTLLLHDHSMLEVEDFGAGSSVNNTRNRSVSSIARNAAKPPRWGQLLFRIVHHYQPMNILELGTSLGLSTAYLAMGNMHSSVITCEGSSQIAARARRNFTSLDLHHIMLKEGHFNETLPQVLHDMQSVDLAFIDGNHRFEPTLNYVHQLLPRMHNDSIIILDDIHWSDDMELAWDWVKKLPQVTLTIDLFFIGLVFFRRESKVPQHFTIRY